MSEAPAAQVTENGVPPAAPGFKVFAGNLAYSTTDEGLKAFFAPVQSDILSAQVIMRGPRSAGYGFVALASAEAAQKAVDALDKQELDGRTVIIEIAKPADQKDQEKKEKRAKRRTSGRRGSKGVPGEVTEAEATGDIKAETPAAANADAPAAPKKKRKPSRRNNKAKVEADEGSPEPVAPQGDGDTSKKTPRARKPRVPRPPRPAGEDPVGEPSKSMLFVANLGFNIDDADLSALFTEANIPTVSARIVRRRWGQPRKSKGYGFVDVGDEEAQKKAIELLDGKEIGGRNIAVKIAVNSPHEDSDEAPVDVASPAA